MRALPGLRVVGVSCDPDLDDSACSAYVFSTANAPPASSNEWQVYDGHDWQDNQMNVLLTQPI